VLEQRGKDESEPRWLGIGFLARGSRVAGRQLLEGAAFRAGLMRWGAAGSEIGVGGRRPGARGLEWPSGEERWGSRESGRWDDDPIAQPLSKLEEVPKRTILPLFGLLFFEESHEGLF